MSAAALVRAVQAEATRRAFAEASFRGVFTDELVAEHLPIGTVVRLAAGHLPNWYRELFVWPHAFDGRAVVHGWNPFSYVTFTMQLPDGQTCQVSVSWYVLEQACLDGTVLEAQ